MLRRAERHGDPRSGVAVFPGGVLDQRDAAAHAHCLGADDPWASKRLGVAAGGLDYLVAAVRETFEEVGLLLAEALGLEPHLAVRQYDRSVWPEMRAAIAAAVRRESREEWCRRLEGSDACCTPILSFDEAPRHAQAEARGAFVEVDGFAQPAPAPRFARTPASQPRPAPEVGAQTDEVLRQAGFSGIEIDALRAAGAAR